MTENTTGRLYNAQNKKPLKAVWPDCEALTFDLETWTFKVKVTDKGHDGKNSSRSIFIWSVKELLTIV